MNRALLLLLFFVGLHYATAQEAREWRIYYDSTELHWGNDWNKCIHLLEKALPLLDEKSGKNDANYVVLLNDLGLCYNYVGQLQKAEEIYKETLAIKKAVLGEDDLDYAATLLNLAHIYQEQVNFLEAEKLYEDILRIFQLNHGDQHPEYAGILNYLGQLYTASGDFSKAEMMYKKALNIYISSYGKENSFYGNTLKNLGTLNRSKGEYLKARDLLTEASAVLITIHGNSHPEVANALIEQASLLEHLGEYGEAELTYIQAIAIQERLFGEERIKLASSHSNLAGLYIKTGNLEKAKSNFESSLSLYLTHWGKENLDYATALNNYANYLIAINDLEQAAKNYQEASEIYKKLVGEMHPLFANTILNLASLYRKLGKYSESEQFYVKGLEIEKHLQGEKTPGYATSLNNLGLLYMAMGKADKAIELYEKALELKKETFGESHPSYATSLNNLAVLYIFQEDFEKALPLLSKAIQHQLNQIRIYFPYMSESEKAAFFNTIREDVERFNSLVIQKYKEHPHLIGEMYNQQLATKSILFHSNDKVKNNILSSNDKKLISTFSLWQKEKEHLGSLYLLSKEELKKQNIDLKLQEEKVNQLEKSISLRSSLFSKENEDKSFYWKDIQKKLKPGEAAVELIRFRNFTVGNDNLENANNDYKPISYGFSHQIYYAAIITRYDMKEAPDLVFLENGEDLENKFISYYKNAIKYKVEDVLSYSVYWEEIQAKLKGVQKIYFAPDGIYNKININMLKIPKTDRFLIDELYVSQLTSTKDLLLENKTENPEKRIVMFGDPAYLLPQEEEKYASSSSKAEKELIPKKTSLMATDELVARLPGTRKEVESIHHLMTKNGYSSEVKLGRDARENTLKMVKNPKILHLATHGFFSNENFTRKNSASVDNALFSSGLLFSGAENSVSSDFQPGVFEDLQEDGILSAYEAMNLSLEQTDLVVLSACETGLGEVQNGEGVFGLQRAFQVAGAKSIIISLWNVDDSATVALMESFYQEWFKIGDKRTAFINAQVQLRQQYPHPYFWGGFLMIGK